MKSSRLLLGVLLATAASSHARDVPAGAAYDAGAQFAPPPATAGINLAPLTPEQLDQLLGPIALYPDALIALILPAATAPADIVLAARHLRQYGSDLSQVEHRAWDDSVKSLVNYPDLVKWMDENLLWTRQLGEAFAEQPAEVMKSLQRLRTRAQSSGALVSTPQQHVLVEQQAIRIVPAQSDVIYVPYYDPAIVYVDRPVYHSYGRPMISFGLGCRVGSWLSHDFDWHRSTIWIGDRHRHWDHRHDWRRPLVVAPIAPRSSYATHRAPRPWQPPERLPRPGYASVQSENQSRSELPRVPALRAPSSNYEQMGPTAPNVNGDSTHNGQRPLVTTPAARQRTNGTVAAPTGRRAPTVTTTPASAPTPTVVQSNRGRADTSTRAPEARVRTYQPPANTTTSIRTAPPLQRVGPAQHSYPTVVAPTYDPGYNARPTAPDRSYSRSAPAPVAAPPLQHVQPWAPPAPSVGPVAAPPAAAAAAPSAPPDRGGSPGRDRRNVD